MKSKSGTGWEIFNILDSLGEIEWRRIPVRYPVFKFKDQEEFMEDRSTRPPATSFRFKNENPQIIEILFKALASYKGKVQWSMISQKKEYGPGINRCILPTYVKELRENTTDTNEIYEYIEKNAPDFGPLAYDDLVDLAVHIRSVLHTEGIDI